MTYQTPYQVKLQSETFHDSDDIAAAWRLFASQIKKVYEKEYKGLVAIAGSLNSSYTAYLKKSAEEKQSRFALTLNIGSELDASGLLNYHAKLRNIDTVNEFRNMSLILHHLEEMFGVPAQTLAGVIAGNLLMEVGIQEIVAQEIATQLGGSSVITDIPSGSLAGQYKPNTFPKPKSNGGNNYQMAFRRRY